MPTMRHRPLLALLALHALLTSGAAQNAGSVVSSSVSTSAAGTTVVRLKATRLRRPEACRESLARKSEDLPALVVTGRVKEVYLAPEADHSEAAPGPASSAGNKALFQIGRVIKGNKQLVGADIIVTGFNSTSATPCPNYVKPNDTLILLLNADGERRYSIQANNLLSMNLANLERVNAIAADEPFRRRAAIESAGCEAHYCAYGRCAANERGQPHCQCPDSCSPLPAPVCGSDGNTYANECHLIREGCKRQRPLFATKESAC